MSRKKQRCSKKGEEGGGASWLTTFNDLMTLLMVFFVLLFSMGKIDTNKLRSFQNALQSGLGVLGQGTMTEIGLINPRMFRLMTSEEELTIKEILEELGSVPGVGTSFTEKGLVITLSNTVFFDSGIAEINPESYSILDRISTIIKRESMPICVEGHTDNDPIQTHRFPSNWDLSTVRAVNVVKYFIQEGKIPPQRLSAAGYGESKPLLPNDTPEHKAENRRVEVILQMKGEKKDVQ